MSGKGKRGKPGRQCITFERYRKQVTLVRKEVMRDGDDGVKLCPNCGEGVYLVDAECIKLCPKCGNVVFQFAKRD